MTVTTIEPRLDLMRLAPGNRAGAGLLFAVATSECAGHPMREAVNMVVVPDEPIERGDWIVRVDDGDYSLTRATADGRANESPGVLGAVVGVEIIHSDAMGEFLASLTA